MLARAKLGSVATVWMLTVIVGACASTGGSAPPTTSPAHELADAPGWVLGDCASDVDAPSLCGVGSMGRSRNPALARSTAIGRARTEIARSLEVKVEAMLKDYQASTTGGAEFTGAAADAQRVEDVSRQITRLSLSGTETKAIWVSPKGTVFALVVLDVDRFRESVAEMNQLSANLRRAIEARSGNAFAGQEPTPHGSRPPLQLVTAEEAALPEEEPDPDTPVWGRKKDSPNGPEIVIRSPEDGGIYRDPFPIDVEFLIGPSGQPVDMESLELVYKKAWGIDITNRVRDYVDGTRIQVDSATLPRGRHKIEISIEDMAENRSSRLFTVVVDR